MQIMDSAKGRRAGLSRVTRKKVKGKGHPSTADMEYSAREIEFMNAMQEFKRVTGRQFPTWSETLAVLDKLGYARPQDAL